MPSEERKAIVAYLRALCKKADFEGDTEEMFAYGYAAERIEELHPDTLPTRLPTVGVSERNLSSYCDDKDTELWKRLAIRGFSPEEIKVIVNVVTSICHECWDAESGCQCWNDE